MGGNQYAVGEAREDQVALRLTADTPVYERPEPAALLEETLPAGTLIIIRRHMGDFVEVVTPSENFGFISASAPVEAVGPAPELSPGPPVARTEALHTPPPEDPLARPAPALATAPGPTLGLYAAGDEDLDLPYVPTERVLIYDRIAGNKRRTFFLMLAFIVFTALVFSAIGVVISWYAGYDPTADVARSLQITAFSVLIASAIGIFMYFTATATVLAISGGHEVTKQEEPQLYRIVENLAIGSGLPMPKVYVIEDSAPNAFATGRDPSRAYVAATRGLLEKLERREIQAVMAHEMSHIGNYDIRLMTVVAVVVGLVALASDLMLRFTWYGSGGRSSNRGKGGGALGAIIIVAAILLIILSPIIASAMRFALSRQREYLADASGALLNRNPDALADALEKIARDPEALESANKATAHLYISNPLKEHASFLNNLFSTHPPVEERIKILRAMG